MYRTIYCNFLKVRISAFRQSTLFLCEEHSIPFFRQYEMVTGDKLSPKDMSTLEKKHPLSTNATAENLQKSQAALECVGISPSDAWQYPSLLFRNRYYIISRYEVLRESGFINITAHILFRFITYVKLTEIRELKERNIIHSNLDMHEHLLKSFKAWPAKCPPPTKLPESTSTIHKIRMNLLRQYLDGRKLVPKENFDKINKRFKHKSLANIEEVIYLAENEYGMSLNWIKRHISHLLCVSAGNAREILQIKQLCGLDVRAVVRMMPSILHNDCDNIFKIISILEKYGIPDYTQRRCLHVFCMSPQTVENRLRQLAMNEEFVPLLTNPRALLFVVNYNKIMKRLELVKKKKQIYSISLLLKSQSIFEKFMSGLGIPDGSRDIAFIIYSNLNIDTVRVIPPSDPVAPERISQTGSGDCIKKYTDHKLESCIRYIKELIRRHSLWMHASHSTVYDNICMLRQHFSDDCIFRQCQILLYPKDKLLNTIILLKELRRTNQPHALLHPDMNFSLISDDQLLSLVFYVIEKKHHFSDNGIWSMLDRTEGEHNSTTNAEDSA